MHLDPISEPIVFEPVTYAVDGLAYDSHTESIYWTGYNELTYVGHISFKSVHDSDMPNDTPKGKMVIKELHRPRAIILHHG